MNAQRNFELPNVSFPDFRDRMTDKLSVLLKPLSELLEIQTAILEQAVTEPLHKTVRMIIKEMTNSLAALSLLALNGYGSSQPPQPFASGKPYTSSVISEPSLHFLDPTLATLVYCCKATT